MYALELTESYVPAQQTTDIRDTTVGGLMRDIAARYPDNPALTEITFEGLAGRRWTYSELLADAERMAHALGTRFAPGERVCVWSPNTPEWVLMEYACGLAGLVLVTANPAYQTKELAYVLEQSKSVGLFLVESYRGNPMAEIGAAAVDGNTAIRAVVDMNDHAALFAHGDWAGTLPEIGANDPAQIQYTSGTTGFPKGAVLSHRALTNNARLFFDRFEAPDETVFANFMPMFHTSGCGMAVLGALQRAKPIVLFNVFDPVAVLRAIESERITTFIAVPTMLVAMLDVLKVESFDLSSLQVVISGGSMVPPELVRNVTQAMDCAFQIVYGQTETAPLITQHHLGESEDDLCNTIGQPMPCTEVSIRSVDDNSIMALGEQGEICVRGYCLMIEYNDNPEATAATIDADGWLHTGDLGRMDGRGYCAITGRVKEMIIRGGENHFPAEIENVLLEHPSVSEVAVVGLPDPKWGEIIACFARPEEGERIDPDTLKSHCRAQLSPQKTPTVWCQVADFPLTGSGKIRKFALRDGFVAGEYETL
ncbi:MAG: AMP-binding protein [Pseudomonadota bacterium]